MKSLSIDPKLKVPPSGYRGQEIEIMGIQHKVPNSDHQMNNYLSLHNREALVLK